MSILHCRNSFLQIQTARTTVYSRRPSKCRTSSTTLPMSAETITNIVFGTIAVIVGIITIWQGYKAWATRRYHHAVKRADGTIAPNKSIFPLGLLANIDPLDLELARRVFWNNPRTETGPHSIAPSLKHNYTSDNPIPGGDLFPNCGPPSVAVPKPPCPAAQRPTLPQCLDNQ